jgi:hypothetical protein
LEAPTFPKHPNLQAAGEGLHVACERIVAAQKDNEYDMEGHAAKAKGHVESAMKELMEAREAVNKNAH